MKLEEVKELLKSLIGTKTIIYVNDELDSSGIKIFTENDYYFYLNEIEDAGITFQSVTIENIKLYNILYLYY